MWPAKSAGAALSPSQRPNRRTPGRCPTAEAERLDCVVGDPREIRLGDRRQTVVIHASPGIVSRLPPKSPSPSCPRRRSPDLPEWHEDSPSETSRERLTGRRRQRIRQTRRLNDKLEGGRRTTARCELLGGGGVPPRPLHGAGPPATGGTNVGTSDEIRRCGSEEDTGASQILRHPETTCRCLSDDVRRPLLVLQDARGHLCADPPWGNQVHLDVVG